jgi:UDP-glucuronate 4-epimerase
MSPILVTGAAGFIGYHVARRLLERGDAVVGLDNLNDYYDVRLKEARLAQLCDFERFSFARCDVADRDAIPALFAKERPSGVVHLAAQAGVRYSLTHPFAYVESNLVGFVNMLEACRAHPVGHLVYASSSSVYGSNEKLPFSVRDRVDHPISIYAATKKSNELLAHSYSHLFRIPTTGLRFFTVYGPWGRPDMAAYKFADAIVAGRPIDVYNHGNLRRDFTYIDDIVEGVIRVLDRPAVDEPPAAPYRVYNIGNDSPVSLDQFISILEGELGRSAQRRLLPMQPGDVEATWADVADLRRDVGFSPATSIQEGLSRFASWYRSYHGAPAA